MSAGYEITSRIGKIPLPDEPLVRPGLVRARDREILSHTRIPLLKGIAWTLIGQRDRRIRIYRRVYDEEMEALGKDMETAGLFGQHPLVDATVIRERVSRADGHLGGSVLFGLSGEYHAESQNQSTVLFAWQTPEMNIILSELETRLIQIHPDTDKETPTVEFEFDASKLLTQPMDEKGALVRYAYAHPNGYIYDALSKATFHVTSPEQLREFFISG